jgi:hypothetical protein
MDEAKQKIASKAWSVVHCPTDIDLTAISKECCSHGSIYLLWEVEMETPCFVSQSVPAVVKVINELAIGRPEKRLHASSLYRCLRGESVKNTHKTWRIDRFPRTSMPEINAHLKQFASAIFVTKSPDKWRIAKRQVDEAPTAAPPSSERGDTRNSLSSASEA